MSEPLGDVVYLNASTSEKTHVGIDAIREIYEKSFSNFYAYAYSLTYSRDLSCEIIQIIFARLVARSNKAELYNIDNLEAYVIRAIRNEAVNQGRSLKKIKSVITEEDVASPESDYLKSQAKNELRDCISGLARLQKVCVVLHYFDDLSVEEISEELGISKSTVKTHLQRAKKKLMTTVSLSEIKTDES